MPTGSRRLFGVRPSSPRPVRASRGRRRIDPALMTGQAIRRRSPPASPRRPDRSVARAHRRSASRLDPSENGFTVWFPSGKERRKMMTRRFVFLVPLSLALLLMIACGHDRVEPGARAQGRGLWCRFLQGHHLLEGETLRPDVFGECLCELRQPARCPLHWVTTNRAVRTACVAPLRKGRKLRPGASAACECADESCPPTPTAPWPPLRPAFREGVGCKQASVASRQEAAAFVRSSSELPATAAAARRRRTAASTSARRGARLANPAQTRSSESAAATPRPAPLLSSAARRNTASISVTACPARRASFATRRQASASAA